MQSIVRPIESARLYVGITTLTSILILGYLTQRSFAQMLAQSRKIWLTCSKSASSVHRVLGVAGGSHSATLTYLPVTTFRSQERRSPCDGVFSPPALTAEISPRAGPSALELSSAFRSRQKKNLEHIAYQGFGTNAPSLLRPIYAGRDDSRQPK